MTVARKKADLITGTAAELTALGATEGATAAAGTEAGVFAIASDQPTILVTRNVAGTITWQVPQDASQTDSARTDSSNTFTAEQTIQVDDASPNIPIEVLTLTHTTSGTPANGIGVGVEFGAEVTAGVIVGATLNMRISDVTAGSEDSTFEVNLLRAGGSAEFFRLSAPADGQAAMFCLCNRGGVFTLDRVTLGADDSGGAGFKCLRVQN